MLGILAFIVLVLWIIGLAVHVFSGAINVLLIVAVALAIAHFFRNKSAPRAS